VRLFYSLPLEEAKITNQRLQQKLNRITNARYTKRLFFLLMILKFSNKIVNQKS